MSSVLYRKVIRRLVWLVVFLLAGFTVPAAAQITTPGTDYVTFWSGELRIFAQKPNTSVTLINVDTDAPLAVDDPRLDVPLASNPFVLANAGDMFLATGGIGSVIREIRIRILTSDPLSIEDKPVTVWVGSLQTSANAWASYIPASFGSGGSCGREVGREFLGFTRRELILVAPRQSGVTTVVQVDNLDDGGVPLVLTFDASIPSAPALVNQDPPIPASSTPCYLLNGPEVQAVYIGGYDYDRLSISSNVDITVLAGYGMIDYVSDDHDRDWGGTDWTASPPSFAAGDDGVELGTLFYTFVRSAMTIFPTEDDTQVTISDLSDGDDDASFVLASGDHGASSYDIYTPYLQTHDGGDATPRSSGPQVFFTTAGGDPFDNDIVRVTTDKPVLVYLGPVGNDIREYADVCYSVPIGTDARLIHTYAQNGGSNDLQLFTYQRETQVSITSLSRSRGAAHHDFLIDFDVPPGTPPVVTASPSGSSYTAKATPGDIQHFGSDAWNGELLRIFSTKPITVISGDYDDPNFGAFLPFTPTTAFLPPVADVTADSVEVAPGDLVTFVGSGSYDQDGLGALPQITRYDWDFGDGHTLPDGGPVVGHRFQTGGKHVVTLTVTDNEAPPDTQSDTDVVEIMVTGSAGMCVCSNPAANYRRPGSLLLFPEYDNRAGDVTVLTVTNTARDTQSSEIGVEFVYISATDCSEFNRTESMTPNDTLTLVTGAHNPDQDRGFVYAFAKDSEGVAVEHDYLVGNLMVVSGIEILNYSINPVAFRGYGDATSGSTDHDEDGIRDLDGSEYDLAPGMVMIPRFLGQDDPACGVMKSELILISLTGGAAFSTIVSYVVHNDNEEQFSGEHAFYCWDKQRLLDLDTGGMFAEAFLDTTADDPLEILGASGRESGWICVEGSVAYSTMETIEDPAIYCVLIERIGTHAVGDLPFECEGQQNGALLPRGLLGDGDPLPEAGDGQ